MPRAARVAPGGVIYHVFNHGNGRLKLFPKDADYAFFVNLLQRAKEAVPMRVLAYCLMPDHWHLVLWPRRDGDLSKFMLRMATAHVRRYHDHHRRPPEGKVYRGRYRNFPVQPGAELLTLGRYVEGNARRAKLVKRAEQWQWGSLRARVKKQGAELLDEWPVARPGNWVDAVNKPLDPVELEALRHSVSRGRPYGSPAWVKRTVERFGLESTIRPQGRPRKTPVQKKK